MRYAGYNESLCFTKELTSWLVVQDDVEKLQEYDDDDGVVDVEEDHATLVLSSLLKSLSTS